jgi:5-formaminoimidazole-4-carboxamide-1-(beta)-D-ribofuranosyl 5'-monophosphate synthetase
MDILDILKNYNKDEITIGVLGGHSALDVCEGAKKMGFQTLAVCQKGREQTYEKYYRTRENSTPQLPEDSDKNATAAANQKGCIDHILLVDKFSDITKPSVQEELRALNTIFIHNRYFWVYCNFDEIENDFNVPVYGSRRMVRLEERDLAYNQYHMLQEAGIRIPRIYTSPEEIDGPVIVKVNEAERSYERAFFVVTTPEQYHEKVDSMLKSGLINEMGLSKAVIEEFIVGAQVNFNYFYSPLTGELELMGTDARRQTSLDGFLRLDAHTQMQLIESGYKPSMIETGHYSVTTKESLIEKIFDIGEKFVALSQKVVTNSEAEEAKAAAPYESNSTATGSDKKAMTAATPGTSIYCSEAANGIIGPFALQGAVDAKKGKEELVIFDVSMRIPGSPGTRFTPQSGYLWGKSLSYGERIAMDIRQALDSGKLGEVVS